MPRILVRRPSPHLADGQLTHLSRSPVDVDLALQQWVGYVEAFRAYGWVVTEVEPGASRRFYGTHLPMWS